MREILEAWHILELFWHTFMPFIYIFFLFFAKEDVVREILEAEEKDKRKAAAAAAAAAVQKAGRGGVTLGGVGGGVAAGAAASAQFHMRAKAKEAEDLVREEVGDEERGDPADFML